MRDTVTNIVEKYLGKGRPAGDSNVLHKCPVHKGGQEEHPSFSINLEKGVFNCFACGIAGSVPKLLRLLGLPASQIELETREILAELEANRHRLEETRRFEWVLNDPFVAHTILSEAVVRDYTKWRKLAPTDPTGLITQGFSSELLELMEVGFDPRNSRVMYPIRDLYGNLAGFSGGTVLRNTWPKYKVYQGKRQDRVTGRKADADYGPWFEEQYPTYAFDNHHFLWNFDRVYPRLFYGKEVTPLIVVEGFKAAMWMIQLGHWNTVALMGNSLSYRQKQQLLRLNTTVLLFLDNNKPGQDGARRIRRDLRCTTTLGATILRYPEDVGPECQPDHLTAAQVAEILTAA